MSAANSSTSPVLCIPRVFPNITEQRIRRIFDDLHLGIIERVDIVANTSKSGENYNRVFVHFQQWNATESAEEVRRRLQEGKEIKIIYDEPWFWKVSAYRPPVLRPIQERTRPTPRTIHQRPKATIEFDNEPTPKPPPSSGWEIAKRTTPNNATNYRPIPITRCESGSDAWLGLDLPNMKNYHSRPPSKQAQEAYLNEFLPEQAGKPPRPTPRNNTKPEKRDSEVTKAIKAEK
jgi:hypothetical protein